MENENTYTTQQAAARLGITKARVRQIAIDHKGAIGRKWGRDWMFTDADLDRMRQRNTTRGPRKIERLQERPA
jgi:hypothetical protein